MNNNQTYESYIEGLGRPFNEVEQGKMVEIKKLYGDRGLAHYVTHYLILLNDLKNKGEDVSDERHLQNFGYLWDIKVKMLKKQQILDRDKQINETMNQNNFMV